MTDYEKKLHRAKLQVEIEDAESDLAFLQDEAIGVSEALEDIVRTIRHNAELEPSPADFTADGDVQNRLTPEQIASFASAGSIASMIENLKKARQAVFNLRERKRKLAVMP